MDLDFLTPFTRADEPGPAGASSYWYHPLLLPPVPLPDGRHIKDYFTSTGDLGAKLRALLADARGAGAEAGDLETIRGAIAEVEHVRRTGLRTRAWSNSDHPRRQRPHLPFTHMETDRTPDGRPFVVGKNARDRGDD